MPAEARREHRVRRPPGPRERARRSPPSMPPSHPGAPREPAAALPRRRYMTVLDTLTYRIRLRILASTAARRNPNLPDPHRHRRPRPRGCRPGETAHLMFERLGSWTYRFRFLILVAWVIAAAFFGALSPSLSGQGSTDQATFLPPNSP